jgi:hypothetical protein
VYIVNSNPDNTAAIRDDLSEYIDANDGLFVAKLTGDAAWQKVNCSNQALKDKLNA